MSTCPTCQPLQLNRSPDYPMTHNAHPHSPPPPVPPPPPPSSLVLLPPVHPLPPLTHSLTHSPPPGLPSAISSRPLNAWLQVCSFADYCSPCSNSGHVKAIPGIPFIVMQSPTITIITTTATTVSTTTTQVGDRSFVRFS
ncbi:hypothetical protein M0804_010684 [Polistes exclamans]|nr:hypothetical protein M0804_010684 [Polistes exclamans]